MLICNSNVKHELSSSEYPTRRKQCNEALKLMGLKSYREANLSDLQGERFAILINLPEFDDSDDFMKTDIALRSVITACSSSYNLFK